MELNEKEAHCVARLLQGAIYGNERNVLDGCLFCKFSCTEKDENPSPHFDDILRKLQKNTGVDLSPAVCTEVYHSDFPYKKFLKNSNEWVKERFRNFFKDI